jgi:predicted AlkP superfamily pyrophosphatase or phosphodiesterase
MLTRCVIFIFLSCVASGSVAQDTIQHTVPGRVNAPGQLNKPYVILISVDGFRYDYAQKYNAVNLLRLRKLGAQAESMIPAYPSVTYPNHYTIATGMYPSHHGIVYNQFYDRKRNEGYSVSDRKAVEDGSWYGGIPLWVLAEQQGMLSAAYHYVGTEAPVQNIYSTYWYRYNSKTPIATGIDAVEKWLHLPDSIRPHLVTFYIGDVDHAGHTYGPGSAETRDAVLFTDTVIGELVEKVKATKLPVNFIFVSDHGMTEVDTLSPINIRSMIDTSKFIIKDGSTSMHLYAKDKADILPAYRYLKSIAKGFTVYLRKSIPARWHYNTSEDIFDRIGDIYILPNHPKVLGNAGHINPGTHGYDPEMKDMHATFYAWGPGIKNGMTISSFENVHVYPLVCRLLGLKYSHKIDGKASVLEKIIR